MVYPSPHQDSKELIKTLLLLSQIDTLLRIAAQPSASIDIIWAPVCCQGHIGWGELMRSTLVSYICLNVSFLKPETYDATDRAAYLQKEHRNPPTEPEDLDYRKAKGYERMLKYAPLVLHMVCIFILTRSSSGLVQMDPLTRIGEMAASPCLY